MYFCNNLNILPHARATRTQRLSMSDKQIAKEHLTDRSTKHRVKELLTYFKLYKGSVYCKDLDDVGINGYEVNRSVVSRPSTRKRRVKSMRNDDWVICQLVGQKECNEGICYTVKCTDGEVFAVIGNNNNGGPKSLRERPRVTPMRVLHETPCVYPHSVTTRHGDQRLPRGPNRQARNLNAQ